MFRGALTILLTSSALCLTHGAQTPGEFYINRSPVTNAMVNARHFINEGDFFAAANVPWDPMNTVTYTNRSTMFSSPGFRFETVSDPFGFRTPAQVFYNSPTGDIQAQDSGFAFIIGDTDTDSSVTLQGASSSLLKINAQSITNRGVLSVGANGFIQLHGQSVDLTAGAIIVGDLNDPLSGGGGGSGFPVGETNFFPSPGIYDLGWGMGAGTNTSVQGVIGSVNPTAVNTPVPAPLITNIFGGGFGGGFGRNGSFSFDEAQTWVREEVIDETNEVVQVIAVQTSDPSIGVFSSFVPQTFPAEPPLGGFLTPIVELRVGSTDFATLARVTNSLYVADQLGSHTNRTLMENLTEGTLRPGNFIVFRGFPDQYAGEPASTNIREDIFTAHLAPDLAYLNNTVSNEWSIYSAQVASAPTRLPQIPGIAITNLGGQVEINASQLKMANTRIRGEGFVSLKASNVTAGANVVIDVPRLSVNFGTGSGVLNVNEFTPDRVERFSGYLVAYSTIFTNGYELLSTNVDPTTSSNVVTTNLVEVRFQLTMVDARKLQTSEETVVQDFKLSSTNDPGSVVYNESLNITNYVEITANNLTLGEGSRLYGGRGVAFSYTNLLNIANFTNLGTIQVNELADLRRSLNEPYAQFVNRSNIFAFGAEIWADYFENTGNISSTNFWTFWGGGRDAFGIPFLSQQATITEGAINIRAGTIRIDSGTFATLGDIRFTGDVLKLSNWQGLTGSRFVLDVGQTITDTGVNSPNEILVFSGFEMSSRRPTGELLGTTITSSAATFEFIDHIWAAEDRGATAAGFDNNVALGRLVLEGGNFSVYQFLPARENSAIYIDVLEIGGSHATSLAALTNGLNLGMNVYYADVVSTNTAITAQSLNRIFGTNAPFNLIWVPDFAGPNSAVDVPLSQNGPVARMNRGLRDSLTADSDGDGVPNARDPYPLSAASGGDSGEVQLVGLEKDGATGAITFSIAGPQAASYVIEYTTNLISPNWQVVQGTTVTDSGNGLKKFTDQANQSAQGYYRVRLAP